MDTVVAASELTKNYPDVIAVDQLTLNIKQGEIYGFLGLNGAGKTTTIRMLLGLIKPNNGTVSLFDTVVKPGLRSIWGRVGYMVETPHAYPDLTVRENLEIIRRLRKLKNADAVDRIIGQLKLTQYARRRAKTLSLGNVQRLGLAKALIHHPDLLVLDEPVNGLDPVGIVEIRNLLKDLAAEQGVTIFISSHILSEIARLAMRIGVVHEGRLIKELTAAELKEQEEQHLVVKARDIEAVQLVLSNVGIDVNPDDRDSLVITDKDVIRHPDNIATVLVQAGYPPTELVVKRGDLESYFLKLVGIKGKNDYE